MKLRDITITGLLAAVLFIQQVLLSGLPNIHLCALLIIAYTLNFPKLILPIITVFILLEGITFGFGIWWVSYLYVWPLLVGVTWLLRKNTSLILWSIVGGAVGLSFGALCAIPYLFVGGPSMAVAYWISGIPYDLTHCLGNVATILLLWKPVHKVLALIAKGTSHR